MAPMHAVLPRGRGAFLDAEQAVATPPFASEPSARGLDRRSESGDSVEVVQRMFEKGVFAPSVEPGSGGTGVEPRGGGSVLSVVHEHIKECVANLPRSRERVGMIPLFPDGPAAREGAIDCARQSDRESAHSV